MVQLLEEYAKINSIPIMQKDGIEFLLNFIKENNIKNILEIGTAIGYSAIRMALLDEDIFVTSIERDKNRYQKAKENVANSKLNNQIKLIHSDAFDVSLNDSFDLIFIDAAKAQNIKFFEKFKVNLNKGGYIITDNLNFHGLVNSNSDMSRNLKQLVRKINNYKEFLKENKDFETTFYEVGDGISISKLTN